MSSLKSSSLIESSKLSKSSAKNSEAGGLKLNGQQEITWPNGNAYDGDWVDGNAEGHGKLIWKSGDEYEG